MTSLSHQQQPTYIYSTGGGVASAVSTTPANTIGIIYAASGAGTPSLANVTSDNNNSGSSSNTSHIGEDGVHDITRVAQAATAYMQKMVGVDAMDDGQSIGPGLAGSVQNSSAGLSIQQSSGIVISSGNTHQQASNTRQSTTGRKKRRSADQTMANAPPMKRPRGRPKGSGAKKPSIAAAPSSLQDGPAAAVMVPQTKRRGRKPKAIMPKPPPLQSIFKSTGSSASSIPQQQGVGVAVGVAGASQGTVASYSIQPTAAASTIGGSGGGAHDRQIMANVSSVNVMIPAATPTIQVTQQQQHPDASNMLQTIGGKKKVRPKNSYLHVHVHVYSTIKRQIYA